MNFWQRLKLGIRKLGPTRKVMFWGTTVALIISVLGLLSAKSCSINISKNEIDKSQTMVDSPGSLQIRTEAGVNIEVRSSSSPKGLTENSKQLILKTINQYPEKEIIIKTNLGDQGILDYARSIKTFIESKTNKTVNIERAHYGNPISGPDMIHIDREQLEITVSSK